MEKHKMIAPATKLLFLTFVAVFVEIGYCIWGIINLPSIWLIPLLLGSYHSGYLFARLAVFRNVGRRNALIIFIAMILMFVGTYNTRWPLLLVTLPFFSAAIQGTRRILKLQCKIPSKKKNSSKFLAMLFASVAALGSLPFVLFVIVVSTIATFLSISTYGKAELYHAPNVTKQDKTLLWFELLHHAHYFAYCYTFWLLLPKVWHPFIGVLFPIGWLGYWILEILLRERTRYFNVWVLSVGHLLSAVAILIMLLSSDISLIIVMWFLTGLGGGTAYMLSNVSPAGDREAFEDVGHVFGCLLAGTLIWFSSDTSSSLWAGCILALTAALVLIVRKSLRAPGQVEILRAKNATEKRS